MPWFKVDDKLHDHRKARKARKAAMGVWVLAGSWCMDNLTDGFVPRDVLPRWGTAADARALVEADLWAEASRDGEPGWQFHDWAGFQPLAAVITATRAAEADAGVRGNHQRWHVKRGISDPDCEYCYQVPDGEPDRVTRGGTRIAPDSPPIPPVPVPIPDSEPKGSPRGAQSLIAEWLEHSPARPPKDVIGQVSKRIKTMLDEGIEYETLRAGLIAWHGKGLHPSTLPSVVHEEQKRALRVVEDPDAWMRRTL